jgi:hypothetical protein
LKKEKKNIIEGSDDSKKRGKKRSPQHRNAMALLIISRSIIGNIQNFFLVLKIGEDPSGISS